MPQRDYRAEYQRRLARAAERGLSRSQARGHARSGEQSLRPRSLRDAQKLEAALKALRATGRQGEAARLAGISPERFRRFLREQGLAERVGRTWRITDQRFRDMLVISTDGARTRRLRGFDEASANGRYLDAVKAFLSSNDRELLLPFEGTSITDASGRRHRLETDPNRLFRLAHSEEEVFHNVYRLVL